MEGKNVLPHVKQAVAAYAPPTLILSQSFNIFTRIASRIPATFVLTGGFRQRLGR